MAKLSAKEIIDSLKEMTLLEIKEVVDLMKEEFGVDPSAVAVAAAPAAEAANEGPSTVDVVTNYGVAIAYSNGILSRSSSIFYNQNKQEVLK